MPPDLVLLSTLIGSNYPCLELIFMVPKLFEPLKFDCIMNIRKKITLNFPKSTAIGFFQGTREFEIAVVNGPSVFEPLKLYCI